MSSVAEPAGMMRKSFRRQKSQVIFIVVVVVVLSQVTKFFFIVVSLRITMSYKMVGYEQNCWMIYTEIMGKSGYEEVVEHKC